MRWLLVLCVLLSGCEEDAYYADGTKWEQVVGGLSPGRILPRDMDARQWAAFATESGIQADRYVKTFSPTWNGFSVAPTEPLNYMDFGAIVMVWAPVGAVGTSNAATFTVSDWPADLLPPANQSVSFTSILTDGGGVKIGGGTLFANTATINFFLAVQSGATDVNAYGSGFTSSGNKGLPSGWLITYPKR